MKKNPLLTPRNLRSAVTFDKATEVVSCLMNSVDAEEIGDAIEAAASDSDLAQAVLFRLTLIARGFEALDQQITGVELVANAMMPDTQLIVTGSA